MFVLNKYTPIRNDGRLKEIWDTYGHCRKNTSCDLEKDANNTS